LSIVLVCHVDGKFHTPQWSHLVAETCSRSLTATYNINRPVEFML